MSQRLRGNECRVIAFEEEMFGKCSRYLVLNLTLSYAAEYRSEVDLSTIQKHRDKLLANRRHNTLLSGIEGYVWKIEEGVTAGLHMHFIAFYDGSRRSDIYLASCIGDYWVDVITHGIGAYWNSNARKDHYDRYGYGNSTGQVDRNNVTKRESLRKSLLYLAKDEQHVSGRENRYCRTFGMSQST